MKYNLPIPKNPIKECTICGGRVELVEEPFSHWMPHKNKIVYGWMLSYKCKKCKEGWTTTESDTISHLHMKTIVLEEK